MKRTRCQPRRWQATRSLKSVTREPLVLPPAKMAVPKNDVLPHQPSVPSWLCLRRLSSATPQCPYQKVAHVSRCSSEQQPMVTVRTASQVAFTSFSFALASFGPPLGFDSGPGSPLSQPNQCAGSIRLTFSVVQPTPLCCRSCGQAMSHLLSERQGFRQNTALEVYFDFGAFAEANAWLLLPGI